jgi:hypothetical protein
MLFASLLPPPPSPSPAVFSSQSVGCGFRCDTCYGWFHARCVNVTVTEAHRLKQFVCPPCKSKEKDERKAVQQNTRVRITHTHSSLFLSLFVWRSLHTSLNRCVIGCVFTGPKTVRRLQAQARRAGFKENRCCSQLFLLFLFRFCFRFLCRFLLCIIVFLLCRLSRQYYQPQRQLQLHLPSTGFRKLFRCKHHSDHSQ